MPTLIRSLFHRYVPAQFQDPYGLLVRLLRTGDSAAYFAMETALLGVALTPLDLLLEVFEQRRYARAPRPQLPLIFVCGAPRTGTTLATQVLINNLPVTFLNNVTSVFPRSPLVANLLFGKLIPARPLGYHSYYGKSDHLSGPNDALYVWDRWLGKDRKRVRRALTDSEKNAMLQFFGAYEQAFGRPMVNKNNNLNVQANVVAEVLENAHFICMTRDPVYLAQSLLRARREIHGGDESAYGIANPSGADLANGDPIEDVCRQVLFHEQKIAEQQRLIGTDRFWIVEYEAFCRQPARLVQLVADQILGQKLDAERLSATLKPFQIANRVVIVPDQFASIQETILRLKADAPEAALPIFQGIEVSP